MQQFIELTNANSLNKYLFNINYIIDITDCKNGTSEITVFAANRNPIVFKCLNSYKEIKEMLNINNQNNN